MKNSSVNLPLQSTKVEKHFNKLRLIISGNWLADLGFEINSQVKIHCQPHQLTLTTSHEDEPVSHMLGGSDPIHNPEEFLIETQRNLAYVWLNAQGLKHSALAAFLKERENSLVLASTILDLIYVLYRSKLLIKTEF